jgi:hypothetical protein
LTLVEGEDAKEKKNLKNQIFFLLDFFIVLLSLYLSVNNEDNIRKSVGNGTKILMYHEDDDLGQEI